MIQIYPVYKRHILYLKTQIVKSEKMGEKYTMQLEPKVELEWLY